MFFKSEAQSRFAFATKQPWAKEWAKKTDYSKLPEKKSQDQEKMRALGKKLGATQ